MTHAETKEKLKKWDIDIALHSWPLMQAFYREMKNKQYGHEETAQAFFFFRDGWIACNNWRDGE